MDDEALIERRARLQRDAAGLVERLDLLRLLGRVGRVVPLGSAVTGLMVWRDIDFGVDARGISAEHVWDDMLPLLRRCSEVEYVDEVEDGRHSFVLRLDGWKLDISIWTAGMPPEVESFQASFLGALSEPLRLTILRLKEAWRSLPEYPEVVSAWQIYDAVRHERVSTLDELDAYLAPRGLPTLRR